MTSILSTKLDAVNDLLVSIGRDPLASTAWSNPNSGITASPSADESAAIQLLDKTNRDVQLEKDWKFNYAEAVAFTADGSGNVILGDATWASQAGTTQILRVVLNRQNRPYPWGLRDVVERFNASNQKIQLYDVQQNTFNMGANSVWYLDVTYLREFYECPEAYRAYVTARAKVRFLMARQANESSVPLARADEERAWYALNKDQLYRAGNKSWRRDRPHRTVFDNYDVARPILSRAPYLNNI